MSESSRWSRKPKQDDYITGDTYARSEVTGDDEYFQFIVPKGKITSENTITMEAKQEITFGLLKPCELLETAA